MNQGSEKYEIFETQFTRRQAIHYITTTTKGTTFVPYPVNSSTFNRLMTTMCLTWGRGTTRVDICVRLSTGSIFSRYPGSAWVASKS